MLGLRSCSSDLAHQVFLDLDEDVLDIETLREGGNITFEQVGGNSFGFKELVVGDCEGQFEYVADAFCDKMGWSDNYLNLWTENNLI